eukprot:ANDGO_07049.mRNA.1 Transcription initiation factor TFIID subunit 14b
MGGASTAATDSKATTAGAAAGASSSSSATATATASSSSSSDVDTALDVTELSRQIRQFPGIKIVYGNVAIWRGPEAQSDQTHRWCVFLRADDENDAWDPVEHLLAAEKAATSGSSSAATEKSVEDVFAFSEHAPGSSSSVVAPGVTPGVAAGVTAGSSSGPLSGVSSSGALSNAALFHRYFSRVEFQLHETFNPPVRVMQSPPFAVCEVGWGSFEVFITLFPRDTGFGTVELAVPLQLYPKPSMVTEPTREPVMSYYYDMVVLTGAKMPNSGAGRKRELADVAPPTPTASSSGAASAEGGFNVGKKKRTGTILRWDDAEERDFRQLCHMIQCVENAMHHMYEEAASYDG